MNNQLTDIQQKALNALSFEEQNFILARQGHKSLSKLTINELKRVCLNTISKAHTDNNPHGQPNNNILVEQTNLLYTEITDNIPKKYMELTGPEIMLAFKLGVRNELGEWFGLCPKTYSLFIKKFFSLPARHNAWNKFLKYINDNASQEKSYSMNDQQLVKCVNDAYTDYLTDGRLPIVPATVYDVTKEILKLKTLISSEKYPEILEIALEEYKVKIKELPVFITKHWSNNPKENAVLRGLIKKVSLKYFYDQMRTQEKTILIP